MSSECVCMYEYLCCVLSSMEWLETLRTLGSRLRGRERSTLEENEVEKERGENVCSLEIKQNKVNKIVPIRLFSIRVR